MATKEQRVALLHRNPKAAIRGKSCRNTSRIRAIVALLALLACVGGAGWVARRHSHLHNRQGFVDDDDQRERRWMANLVLPEGYPLQEHTVETEDGYLLGLYRIPFGRIETPTAARPVVLLQHGVLDSSATWVLNGGNRSLAFILADAGWDVWMSNSRGNTFSKAHRTLDVNTKEFWDFTFDEMAKYDIPATMEAILEMTKAEKLAYVGHSQGTLIGFLSFAENKRLADRVSLAVMMAPVMYVTHITSPFLKFLAFMKSPELMYGMGWKEFMPRGSKTAASLFSKFCDKVSGACRNIMMSIAGYNADNLDDSRWDYYAEFSPAGTSAKNMVHWTQGVNSADENVCQAYNYGTLCHEFLFFWKKQRCNQLVYGSKLPKAYNLTGYTVPTALLWGGQDMLADVADVALLIESMSGTKTIFHQKFVKEYEHLDFTWGIDAHEKIYPGIVKLMVSMHHSF